MKICVIGTGYVGLVTGTCFAEAGNEVFCVDIDAKKVEALKNGIIPIYEPGLEPMVKENVAAERLHFTTDLALALNQSAIAFIAVGTPPNEDGSADLSHVLGVAAQIAKIATKKVVIATKSTVPVGTGDKIEAIFKESLKHPFVVFSNPEFLKEGDAVHDFMKPDRVVVGVNDRSIVPLLEELYAPFTKQRDRLVVMNRKSAELTKYSANAMLAVRISFMNELANLCEKVGANIHDIRKGIGSDPRIGAPFLYAGMGYGGSCFPKDVKALSRTAKEFAAPLLLVDACEQANEKQKQVLVTKIKKYYQNQLKGKTIAVWGLAFKAKTDDIRESPALAVIDQLLAEGVSINTYDPEATTNVKQQYGHKLNYHDHPYTALTGADALIIATDWNEFRSPDFDKIKSLLKAPVIFDGRNLLNSAHVKELGFYYEGIGL